MSVATLKGGSQNFYAYKGGQMDREVVAVLRGD